MKEVLGTAQSVGCTVDGDVVPENSLAIDRGAITRAAAITSSMEMLPLCWMFFSFTVTLRPFQSAVALAMSSPIFLGDRPSGPTLGARELVAPTSPPTALR